jgi:hypothetical protein
MAMACFGLVTFLPLRPDLSLPCFISLISVSTFLPAEGEYFRREDFLFDEDFFVLVRRREELPELRLRPLLDDFFEAFLVAMPILLEKSDGLPIRVSCMENRRIRMNGEWSGRPDSNRHEELGRIPSSIG